MTCKYVFTNVFTGIIQLFQQYLHNYYLLFYCSTFQRVNNIYKYDFTANIFTLIVAYYTAITTKLSRLFTFIYKIQISQYR